MVLMCFIAVRFKHMKYDFWYISIRYLFHKDRKPYKWLLENHIFALYFGYIIIESILLIGLLHQLRSGAYISKYTEFKVGGPIASLLLICILSDLYTRIDTIPQKRILNKIKLKIVTFDCIIIV